MLVITRVRNRDPNPITAAVDTHTHTRTHTTYREPVVLGELEERPQLIHGLRGDTVA